MFIFHWNINLSSTNKPIFTISVLVWSSSVIEAGNMSERSLTRTASVVRRFSSTVSNKYFTFNNIYEYCISQFYNYCKYNISHQFIRSKISLCNLSTNLNVPFQRIMHAVMTGRVSETGSQQNATAVNKRNFFKVTKIIYKYYEIKLTTRSESTIRDQNHYF